MTLFLPEELYLTNIPGAAVEPEVVGLFQHHGAKVREYVVVSKKRETNMTQAALVRMEDHASALVAKKALNRFEFMGKTLKIRW
jgi:RNA recognition motif-containing protein